MTRRAAMFWTAVALSLSLPGVRAQPADSRPATGTQPPASDWPAYRRDPGLTGFSPLTGGLAGKPRQRWSYDLGGTQTSTEEAQLVDVDGDGHDELLRVLADRLICQTVDGRQLWESRQFAHPQVIQMRDFAGDGTLGLLIASSSGVAHDRYLVNGVSGRSTLLYTCGNVFGRYERVGQLLPGVPGQQLCAWWSGDSEVRFGSDGAQAGGYLWSFERGLDEPVLRFEAHETGTIYAPLHLLADMNGDGSRDMVMISHEAMWVYDLDSGNRITHSVWGPQIRTYWASTGAVSLAPGELPSLLMINPMIPGVQVVTQDGVTARSRWKVVVGQREDQYQTQVQVTRAAPDPFVDLDGDGTIEILAAVTNEHGDGKTHLVVFRASDGARLCDIADWQVVTVDELDGQASPEILIQEADGTLLICQWTGSEFHERWNAGKATPVLQPEPSEGHLERAIGARSSGRNMPLERDADTGSLFLLQFDEDVWSCELRNGIVERVRRTPLSSAVPPPDLNSQLTWDGSVLKNAENKTTYQLPSRNFYQAPPPLAARLGERQAVVVREHSGRLVSLSPDGQRQQVLAESTPSSQGFSISDLNGDGKNEVLLAKVTDESFTDILAVDETGQSLFQVAGVPDATGTEIGPTGRLGTDGDRWFVVRRQLPYRNTQVTAYHGADGRELWTRDYLGPERVPATKFMLHLPTAVHDVDSDGADELIASSENWYGLISVRDNRLASEVTTITAAVPGHWGAYATPIVAALSTDQQPQVFHNNAYALTMLTSLQGAPVWHYGLTRDTTHSSLAGFADLDGDGSIEIITTQQDGVLRAFNALATDQLCPRCPPDQELTPASHGGHVRWETQLPPPVSDFASMDIDADGCVELLCGCGDGYVYALKEKDGVCATVWKVNLGAPVGSPVVADLDDDGTAEILITTDDGRLHCLESSGH